MRSARLGIIALVATLGACGGARAAMPTAPGLEVAVRDYTSRVLRGDDRAAWAMISSRCQSVLDENDYQVAVRAAPTLYGTARLLSIHVSASGDTGYATYTFDQPAIDQHDQKWRLEGNSWRRDAC